MEDEECEHNQPFWECEICGNIRVPKESVYMGEICSECGEARMLHPQVYVYTCPYCRFSYQVNPVSNTFSRDITILNKGEVSKQRKKRH